MPLSGVRSARIFGLLLLCGTVAAVPAISAADGWSVPLAPSRDPMGPFARVRLPKISHKGDQPHGFALSLQSGKAVVCYLDAMLGFAKKTRVFLCDINRGAVLLELNIEGAYLPFDFSPDGTRVVCRLDHNGIGKRDNAVIWTMAADGATSTKSWVPYDSASLKERDVIWAGFAGSRRVVTLSSGGQLVVWDAVSLKPLHTVSASTTLAAVSPDGNYVAFENDTKVGLLDVSTGAVLGFIPLGSEVQSAALAFRSDGQAVLCASKDKVFLIDPVAGTTRTCTVSGIKPQSFQPYVSVGWADDRLLFVNENLVDPDVPMPVWSYRGAVWSRPAGGHVWFLAIKGMTDVGLVPLRLPQSDTIRKIMASRGDSSQFILRPGDSVRVDVHLVPEQHQSTAQQTLEQVLLATNYKPDAKASVILEAVPGKETYEERTYELWKFGFGAISDPKRKTFQHRFRVQPVELRLTKDGKVLWLRRTRATPPPPSEVKVNENESLDDKLEQLSATDYGLLRKIEVPKFLRDESGGRITVHSLGNSTVTPDGIDESPFTRETVKDKIDQQKKTKPARNKLGGS